MTEDKHYKELALIQNKSALIDNVTAIPHCSGEGNSCSFNDFFEKYELSDFFGWSEEER